MLKSKTIFLVLITYCILTLALTSLAPYAVASTNEKDKAKTEEKKDKEEKNSNSNKEDKEKVTGNEKVYVCHATGSEKNPFVLIWVSIKSLLNNKGHNDKHHTNDITNVDPNSDCGKKTSPKPSASATTNPSASASPSASSNNQTNGSVLGTNSSAEPKVIGTSSVNVDHLPNTGLPLAALALLALIPAGLKLRKIQ